MTQVSGGRVMATPFKYTMALDDFDVSVLPHDARDRGSRTFRDAVKAYLHEEFGRMGGWCQVQVDTQRIEVSWTPEGSPPDPMDQIVGKLQRGDRAGAVTLLQLLLSDRPQDVTIFYNLGMALSDVGRLSEAEQYLRRAIQLAPDHVNARVALGVALQRQRKTDAAIEELEAAVAAAPSNVWARRNLGACLLAGGAVEEAVAHLREATRIEPRDQQSWYGLAQALERFNETTKADEAYERAIEIDEYSKIAELARAARSQLAHSTFRARGGGERPDAVMYCLGALERFEQMSTDQVRQVGFEIAILGQGGLDVNDPAQKYRLKSLPGPFSGLHLVCLMYVAFKQFAPEQDVGFDLGKEYEEARALHLGRGTR